jgi:hypothetical protein
VPALSLSTPRGETVSPTFRQAGRRLTGQLRVVSRRLRMVRGANARRQLLAQRRSLTATQKGVARCRAGGLSPPAAARRTFAFVCLHGFALPAVMVRGSCAIDLRPRGIPDRRARASAYSLSKTYGTLDAVMHAECTDDEGTLEGPERMEDVYGLYLVRCGPAPSEPQMPAGDAWGVLRMDVENCDEILAADENGCGPSDPRPAPDPPSTPRDPPAGPQGDCIVLRMETENPDC